MNTGYKLTKTETSLALLLAKGIVIIIAVIAYFIRLMFFTLFKLKRVLWKLAVIILIVYSSLNTLNTIAYAPPAHAVLNGEKPFLSSVQDEYIYTYAVKYARPDLGKSVSFLRYQLSCLAFKENGYHSNSKCGDGGLACGEFQFHPGTYTGFRQEMINDGLTNYMGSRLNDKDATETTAWAITHGHELDWGPLLRGECY